MTPERWQKVKEIFNAAMQRAPEERSAFLSTACGSDESLRKEVESLLASHEKDGRFIDSPAYKGTGEMLADDQQLTGGQTVGHYKILSTLGKGGMGEVYLAEDSRLGRKVALKFLPSSFTKDQERLRRFEQEARSASALNHHNILTIYEIGETDGRRFMATEFIDGETLRQKMREGPLKLAGAVNVAEQIASALAEAHAAGIIHRDIKPENIMLRRDGYVKVLDFGLAKLIKPQEADLEAATRALVQTDVGVVMGTAQYMSPEQARGLEVDARSDIWSTGVLLYEMLTGSAPFSGATTSDVIASILERNPPSLTRLAPQVPEALDWIVTKTLAKDKEERYQTAREMLIDLRRLKQRQEFAAELERSTPPGIGDDEGLITSGKRASSVGPNSQPAQTAEALPTQTTVGEKSAPGLVRRHQKALGIAVALLVLVATAIGLYRTVFSHRISPLASFQTMKIGRLTSTGKATDAAISPDGKYVVYVLDDAGQQSLWLRHVPTNSDKEIVAPDELQYRGLIFSHDGNYVYFIGSGKDKTSDGLYQVTVLGGDMRKLTGNIGGSSEFRIVESIALSPDDHRVAFGRKPDANSEGALIVMKTDGTEERKLMTRNLPDIIGQPGWSPDGKTIVCFVANISAGYSFHLFELNVEDGKERQLSPQKWWTAGRIAWLRDGSGFVMTAADEPFGLSQVWFVSYPGGKPRQVTNDLNQYVDVSLTADSAELIAVQDNRRLNISIAPNGDGGRFTQIMSADASISHPSWATNNQIIYDSLASGKRAIWIMDADGKNQKQLIAAADTSMFPSTSSDGRYVVFFAYSDGAFHIWRVDADGSNLKQLTSDEAHFPAITHDGKWVVYYKLRSNGGQIWRVPIEGGAPVAVTGEQVNAISPSVSPDAKWIACDYASAAHPPTPGAIFNTAVIPFEGGEPIKIFDVLGGPDNKFGWAPDSRALTYSVKRNGVSNIWVQPLDGSKPKQLTDFKSDEIFFYSWSADGKQLLCLRGNVSSDVVMLNDFK